MEWSGQAIMTVPKNDKFKDYARYAELCLNMVAATRDQQLRCIQREMAAEWLRLADTVQRGALVGPSKCKWDDTGRASLGGLLAHSGRRRHPDRQKQRPQRGLAGVLYARLYRTGAWGAGGLEAPGVLDFEPDRFRNLYQIAHSERRWKKIACQPK